MLPKRLDQIEESKGDDDFCQVLYSTKNSFILNWPAIEKSITVDKDTLKVVEHELFDGEGAELIEKNVYGFLGVLSIYGLNHFVIATQREKVCDIPTYKQAFTGATAANIYALKAVKLLPMSSLVDCKRDLKK